MTANNLTLAARIYFRIREWKLIRRYLRRLRKCEDLRLTGQHSLDAYQAYDNREQLYYESKSVRTLHNGSILRISFKEIREYYLSELFNQIDELLQEKTDKPVKVL